MRDDNVIQPRRTMPEGRLDDAALAALRDHRHQMTDCGGGIHRCQLCMLELRECEGER